MKSYFTYLQVFLFGILSFGILKASASANQQRESPIEWEEIAPGVWKGIVGKPETLTLLGCGCSTPQRSTDRFRENGIPCSVIKRCPC
jgi:hypothetical protein